MRYADVGLITRTFQARGGHVAALLNHRAQCGECEVIALVPLIVPTPRPRPEPDRAKVLALLDLPAPSTLPSLPERERLRRAQGLTQAQVAEVLGVNRVTVAKWEAGRCEPRGEVREQYAELLRLIAERHPAPDGGGAP